ncbi:MAG: PD-(D/E)XK nuclease family transposase, partial [Desulfarculales bacterium]|nr:PD-(D/E)XK nuclease family transposase [Desulfarculales bacterium]
IYIADHVLIEESEAYFHRFRLYDENTRISFPDSIEINTLEIPKASTPDGSPLGEWMSFFRAGEKEEFMAAAQTNPAIAEAWGVIKVLSGDERARLIAEAREKARMDFDDNYNGAYQEGERKGRQEGEQKGRLEGIQEGEQKGRLEGIQEGEQKGRLEGKLEGKLEGIQEVAANALRENMPAETVARLTGLPLAEVKQIAAQLDSK